MTKQFVLLWKEGTWRKALCVLCILACSLTAFAQKRVSGRVVDAVGEVVAGANVVEKGTSNGVITDMDGRFTLSVRENAVLRISYVGYVTQEVAVANRTTLDITLQEDAQALDEVVVVGYGTQKKVNLSGAVSTISAKAMANRPVANANTALQGLAPNVNITRGSGIPGDAPGINIRGYTSINGGDAFVLIDGVPASSGDLSRINPSDIESISALKDAASAAIYGARAAFGVILVTTKRATSNKIRIDADYTYNVKQFDNLPEPITDGAEYMRLMNIVSLDPNRYSPAAIDYAERRKADPSLPVTLGPGRENGALNDRTMDLNEWEHYGSYNWGKVVFKDFMPTHTANVRISQKGEKLAYSASGGFYQEGGMLNYGNEDYKRFNFRGNATYDMTDRWKLGTNIVYNHTDFFSAMRGNSMLDYEQMWFYRVYGSDPTTPLYNPDGSYTGAGANTVGTVEEGAGYDDIIDETQLSFNTSFDIIKDVWTVSGDATFRIFNSDRDFIQIPVAGQSRPGNQSTHWASSAIWLDRNINRRTDYNLYTNFRKTFAGRHYVAATLGYNQYHESDDYSRVSRDQMISESLPDIALTRGNLSLTHGFGEYALRGVFGRVNYIFDDRYILEANGRYDGSSRFPKGNRFGFFPSGSAAWVVSKEAFMERVNETIRLSNMKLRGSYGSLGNQNIGNYDSYATMGVSNVSTPIYDGNYGNRLVITAPGATPGGLTWETVRTVNGGIDIGFLKNRLDLTFDIYTRYTENMLTRSKTLPNVFGVDEPRENAADLKTKGWDLSVGWRDAVQLGGSPLNYSVRVMIADNRSWITRFDNPNRNLSDYYEGQELGEIWGYTTLGYFDSENEAKAWADQTAIGNAPNGYAFHAGDLKFEDLNDDGKINDGSNTVDDPGDRTIIGNSRERLPYSIDLGADWKGFDLRIFFQGIGERQVYATPGSPGDALLFWGFYRSAWANGNTKNRDRWTEENPSQDAYFPRLKPEIALSGEMSKPQTRYLQDASYLRLKNIMLGYTLPSQWLKKMKIDNLRVFVSCENVLTFHHIDVKGNDPERFGPDMYYPFQRTYSFGLTLGL
jgi:TonB-linked SusC/RagA family outer membrane protein